MTLEERLNQLEARTMAFEVAMESLLRAMMENGWNEGRMVDLLEQFLGIPVGVAAEIPLGNEVKEYVIGTAQAIKNIRMQLNEEGKASG